MNKIEIVSFTPELSPHFTALNIAWLQQYFYVEPIDEQILSAPKENIIDKGGHIYFALLDGKVVGTFAFIKLDDAAYELSKMAVEEGLRGAGVGNQMLTFAMEEAKKLGAQKVILYSNTKLQPAIHLYHKYGFTEVPLGRTDYKRSDIKMEKVIA